MMSTKETFRRLLSFTRPLTRWMLLAMLLGLLTVIAGIGLMALSAYVITVSALHPSLAALTFAIIGVRFFGITRAIYRYLERVVSHTITFKLLAELRVWFYKALEPLAPARLAALANARGEEYTSGELLSRLVSDIETLQEFYVRVLAPPIVAALIAVIMWFVLGAFHPVFVLIFLAFYLCEGVFVPLLIYRLSHMVGQQLVQVRATLNTTLIDGIQGMGDILAFGQERRQQERVRMLDQHLTMLQGIMARVNGLQEALGTLFTNLALWVIVFVGVPLVSMGQVSGISLAVVALAVVASFEAVLSLPVAAQHLGTSLEAARRLFAVVDAQPVVSDALAVLPLPTRYDLEVQHLSFRYPTQKEDALENVSFTLSQGQCIALVGPSGAGKSTIANLLVRFWEYSNGHILLDGRELREYRQEDIHRLIGVVQQDTYLFNATIRDNLLIAKPEASQEELEQAVRAAQLYDFIRALPQGYDTRIGEQGVRLSGGERQRLAIARVLLKDAPILILDEATANLDAITEQELLQTIRTLIRGKTTLIITHRLVGLEMANEILVMQSGRIRECGTQHELLEIEGLYWKLWQLQNQMLRTTTSS